MTTLADILTQLKAHGAKIAGSYARGEQRPDSDLDVFIPEKNWAEVRKVLIGAKFESTAIGQFCSFDFTPKLEVSWRFNRQQNKLPQVTIAGVTFKTR